MNNRDRNKRIILKAVAFLLAVVLILSSVLLFLHIYENRQDSNPAQGTDISGSVIQYNGKDYILKDNVETVLVMGLDKFEDAVDNNAYNNDQQSDFMMLLVIDNENSKCSAIHINRDTIAEMNVLGVAGESVGTVKKQIALAHTYGNGREVSCRNAADSVSKLLMNIKVKHYISLTMDSVPIFNDMVGGVEVNVLDDFTGIDDTLVQGQNVTLLGQHALTYVRTRYGLDDSSNNHRMIRQRQYLRALHDKTVSRAQNDADFIINASTQMSEYLVSDCTVTHLQTLFERLTEYEFDKIYSYDGNTVKGEKFMEFYADENSIKQVVIDNFYKLK